ncbi:MAG: hypothetical protein ACE15E_25030 [Acidobacteriota bacterium]
MAKAGWSVIINYVSAEEAALECRKQCLEASPASA